METEPRFLLRGYEPGDEHAILRTFNEVFREVCGESYVDRPLEFWQWEFEHNPWGHRISLAFTPDGTCAAQYAGAPYPMTTAFGDCIFVHIVDSMAHPEFRKGLKRPGLFIKTALPWFEMCFDKGDAVLFGYPVPIAERIGQRYLEYKRLRVVDYLVRYLDSTLSGPEGVEVTEVAEIPAEVDALFDAVAKQKKCLATRRREFLTWRWAKPPGAGKTYQLLTARRQGTLCGFAVVRAEHELVPGACTIADWLVPEEDTQAQDALLARAFDIAQRCDRQVLMTVFPDSRTEYERMRSVGFEVMPSKNYLERRLTHRIYHPQMTTEWLQEHWWYTLGDSDLV